MKSNEIVYENFGMGTTPKRIDCRLLKWVVWTCDENELVNRLYMSDVEGQDARGRSPVKWRERYDEHGLDYAVQACHTCTEAGVMVTQGEPLVHFTCSWATHTFGAV